MTLIDGVISIIIVFLFFYIIYVRLVEKNPKLHEFTKDFIPTNLYTKIDSPIDKEKIQQVYDEKRTMM